MVQRARKILTSFALAEVLSLANSPGIPAAPRKTNCCNAAHTGPQARKTAATGPGRLHESYRVCDATPREASTCPGASAPATNRGAREEEFTYRLAIAAQGVGMMPSVCGALFRCEAEVTRSTRRAVAAPAAKSTADQKTSGRLKDQPAARRSERFAKLYEPSRGSAAKGWLLSGEAGLSAAGRFGIPLLALRAPNVGRRWLVRRTLYGRRSTSSTVRPTGPRRTAS